MKYLLPKHWNIEMWLDSTRDQRTCLLMHVHDPLIICCHHSMVPYYSMYRSRSIIHWIGYRFWSNNVDDIGHLLCAADSVQRPGELRLLLGIWRIEFIEPARIIQCKELHFPANCCDHVGSAMILITTVLYYRPMWFETRKWDLCT